MPRPGKNFSITVDVGPRGFVDCSAQYPLNYVFMAYEDSYWQNNTPQGARW